MRGGAIRRRCDRPDAELSLHLACEHVGFNVHAVARAQLGEPRRSERVRDEHHCETHARGPIVDVATASSRMTFVSGGIQGGTIDEWRERPVAPVAPAEIGGADAADAESDGEAEEGEESAPVSIDEDMQKLQEELMAASLRLLSQIREATLPAAPATAA